MRRAALGFALFAAMAAGQAHTASVESKPYGVLPDGQAVSEYTLRNDAGMEVRFIGYGGIITAIEAPDRAGKKANVVLGFANLNDYVTKNPNYFFGVVVGRYANRIAGAKFMLDGREVRLKPNDGPNALHGGAGPGYNARLWQVEPFKDGDTVGATLRYTSPDGEQGFPGTLDIRMTYRLTPANELRIDYEATTDKPTVVNLTNHSYFNLAGAGQGDILGHTLQIAASRYAVADERRIPTGELAPVDGTPLDFRALRRIGESIDSDFPQVAWARGYDHGFVLDKSAPDALSLAARLTDPKSGRVMEVLTTEPSIQVYTGNFLGGPDAGAQGVVYPRRGGVALETQHLADSPNKPQFPSTVLRPGETYRSTTVFRFSVDQHLENAE